MTYYEPLAYVVTAAEDGWTLDAVLRRRMGISRKLLSRLKRTECGILVDGMRQYTSFKVRAGNRIEVRMEREVSEHILPQPMPLDILYEDEHLLVLNKPAGLIVHPTHGHYINTLANGVVHYWQERGEQYRFRPVHRLDQETSGVLAVAKNPFAHQQISLQLQRQSVEKVYLALVHGRMEALRGTVDAPIDRDPTSPHIRIVTPEGYRAVTHFESVKTGACATLVRLRLETGRTHQIRVHMKHIGHPLLGDKLYGAEPAEDMTVDRQALHAESLALNHPADGRRMHFTAPLPADMKQWIDRWIVDNNNEPGGTLP